MKELKEAIQRQPYLESPHVMMLAKNNLIAF